MVEGCDEDDIRCSTRQSGSHLVFYNGDRQGRLPVNDGKMKKQISVTLSEKELKRLEAICKRYGWTKSEAVRNMINKTWTETFQGSY